MEQLTQKLKDGKMQISEVPVPSLLKGNILVFNWTDNEFAALPIKDIKHISPLSTVLGNKRDG